MKISIYTSRVALCLCLTVLGSCRTTPNPVTAGSVQNQPPIAGPLNPLPSDHAEPNPPISPAVTNATADAGFRRGRALLETGNYLGAVKQFAYLRDHAATSTERDRAIIGLSMAMQESGNNGAALGALEPLPLEPKTGLEAMKCVLAGEIHLHQKNFGHARIWLIRGLEVEAESKKTYRATALFNLGKALLAEDSLDDAYIAFEAAQGVFTFNGDEANAKQCKTIVADIRQALL